MRPPALACIVSCVLLIQPAHAAPVGVVIDLSADTLTNRHIEASPLASDIVTVEPTADAPFGF